MILTLKGFSVRQGRGRKWYDAKGYGFIGKEDCGDIFVHYSNIVKDGYKTLIEWQRVEFDIAKTPKGFQAENVIIVQ